LGWGFNFYSCEEISDKKSDRTTNPTDATTEAVQIGDITI
jgi:serine protease inhibitor ecotin